MATLRDYIRIKHGYAFKGQNISTIDNNVVLVTPGNFSVGGGFKEDKCKYFDAEYPYDYVLKEDDLIVTMTDLSKSIDTLGYSALVPTGKNRRVYLHNQRIGLVTINSDELNKHYIYWFMRSPYYQKMIAATSTGSTVHHTSPDRILDVEIELPKLEDQNKIAAFLDNIENRIQLNNEINNNLPFLPCNARIAAKQCMQTPKADECLHTDSKVSVRGGNEETAEQFSSLLVA